MAVVFMTTGNKNPQTKPECKLFKKEGVMKSGIELWKERVGWCETHDCRWNKAVFKTCVRTRPMP